MHLGNGLALEQYDQDNFGFLRIELSKTRLLGTYFYRLLFARRLARSKACRSVRGRSGKQYRSYAAVRT